MSSGHYGSLLGNISPETLENLIESISFPFKSVIQPKGYFPLKQNLSNPSRSLVIDHCTFETPYMWKKNFHFQQILGTLKGQHYKQMEWG